MTDAIKVFKKGSEEYSKLEAAARLLEQKSPNGYRYAVNETWFDYGQNWKWTTILGNVSLAGTGGYQALNPKEQEDILKSDDLDITTDEILASRFCPDRRWR